MSEHELIKRVLAHADEAYRLRAGDTVTLGAYRSLATGVMAIVTDHDGALSVRELVRVAHANAVAKGFHDPAPTFGDFIALAHSELSEALEAYREHGLAAGTSDGGKPEGVASELADTVIRIADMCGALGLDLEGAIVAKVAHNAGRPYRHGGKRL